MHENQRCLAALSVPVILAGALLCGGPAHAQDRMPRIPADEMTPEQRQAVSDFRAARNAEPTGPFVPMLRSPEVLTRARASATTCATRRASSRGTASS
jgi:4-carboxymuconolactone decarboxylase